MSSLRALASNNWRSVLTSSSNGRCSSYRYLYVMTPTIHGSGFSGRKGFSFIDDRRFHGSSMKMETGIHKNKKVGPEVPSSRKPFVPTWAKWTFGAILSLLHFGEEKWKGFLRLEGQVEKVADMVENAAEVVEMVAGVAEKVSAKVADTLPKDSTLKDAALLVEHVSKEAVKDAHITLNLIHKVDELKEEVAETIVETIRETGKKK